MMETAFLNPEQKSQRAQEFEHELSKRRYSNDRRLCLDHLYVRW
jgi:hypothetical protein